MPVVMRGGTSGNREDALPKVSVPFDSQTPEDTSGGTLSPMVHFTQCSGNRDEEVSPPVPLGGKPDDSAT